MHSILVIDDDANTRNAICQAVAALPDTKVHIADGSEEIKKKLSQENFDVVLLDLQSGSWCGQTLLQEIKKNSPQTEVVIIASDANPKHLSQVYAAGAFALVNKPVRASAGIINPTKKAIEHRRLAKRLVCAENELLGRQGFDSILSVNVKMQKVIKTVKEIAQSDANVLIQGEVGTGKELVARAIHFASERRGHIFCTFACEAMSELQAEIELFGDRNKKVAKLSPRGTLAQAHGGTLFIDELSELPPSLQNRFYKYIRETSGKSIADGQFGNVRFIASTSKRLDQQARSGNFSSDLLQCLNHIAIALPPLRERREDIAILTDHFLSINAKKMNKTISGIDDDVKSIFLNYTWPGNVRELEGVIERAVILARGTKIDRSLLPQKLYDVAFKGDQQNLGNGSGFPTYKSAKRQLVDSFTYRYVDQALKATQGNITRAAGIAGMERSNFKKLMNQASIDAGPYRISETPAVESAAEQEKDELLVTKSA